MDFVAIIGDPGSGKTNLLVKYLYSEYKSGSPIISNMSSLKFPQRYMGFSDFIKSAENAGAEFNNSVVGTDELGIGADSYDFLSKANRGLANFNAQRRKYHLRWFYTVQRFNMISRRLRLLTDGFISMSDPDKYNMFYPDGRKAKHHREVCQGIFRAEYFDRDMRLIRRRLFNGRKYWGLYDTDERIAKGSPVPNLELSGDDEDY